MNEIRIAEKNIRESFRNTANYLRRLENKVKESIKAKDLSMADYYNDMIRDTCVQVRHSIAALSWAGFKITYTGYSKYSSQYAGDPHVTYIGFTREEA